MAGTFHHRRSRVRASQPTPTPSASQPIQSSRQTAVYATEESRAFEVRCTGDWTTNQLVEEHGGYLHEEGDGSHLEVCFCQKGDCKREHTSISKFEGPPRNALQPFNARYPEFFVNVEDRHGLLNAAGPTHGVLDPNSTSVKQHSDGKGQPSDARWDTAGSRHWTAWPEVQHQQTDAREKDRVSIKTWAQSADDPWNRYNMASYQYQYQGNDH